MGLRIAVTGGMGFIGHEVVKDMLDSGHEVIVVDFWKDILKRYEKARLPIMADFYRDLTCATSVVEPWNFIQDIKSFAPHVVVHAGAVVDTKDLGSDDLFDKNVTYTQDLTVACSAVGSHIIFFSSAAVYGASGYPNNPYGLTKAMGEKIIQMSKTRTASIRLFNVFGRNEHHKGEMASVPWKIANSIRSGGWFGMHSMSASRDFVPVDTVVESVAGLVDTMQAPKTAEDSGKNWHKVYDVGTGIPTTFSNLAKMVCDAMGRRVEDCIQPVDMPLELVGRYQTFTCAGKNGVENLGGKMGTDQGIRRVYGVDD
jgi:ADP-L-glycero-D-manno-heptose 6-epimerase